MHGSKWSTVFSSHCAQSFSSRLETPLRSPWMSKSLPKIYIVTGHLWHHTVALRLDRELCPVNHKAFKSSTLKVGTLLLIAVVLNRKYHFPSDVHEETNTKNVIIISAKNLLSRTFSCYVSEMIWCSWFIHSFVHSLIHFCNKKILISTQFLNAIMVYYHVFFSLSNNGTTEVSSCQNCLCILVNVLNGLYDSKSVY